MKKIIIIILVWLSSSTVFAKDISEKLKNSIVYLQISYHGYEQYQPWKNKELSEGYAVGCAVAGNKVITLASNVANAAFIQARKADKNEFIPAKVLIADYESNLALIELDANSLGKPLEALKFSEKYEKGAGVSFYWLSASGQMYNGRGFLDRVTVDSASIFYSKTLMFVTAGISEATNLGQLYCLGDKPIGIASWSGKEKEADIIPSKFINRFLKDFEDGSYDGIAMKGFETSNLLEPAMRKYLKLPENINHGVYVSDVYTIGTGSDVLKQGDVLLTIDGYTINPYGRYKDKQFGTLLFDNLVTCKTAGQKITFEIWRDEELKTIEAAGRKFDVTDMLIPWYEVDRQPEYAIVGGCILQKLTRSYMMARGEKWEGMAESHIYHYLLNESFKPSDERKDVVILSYCMPANINIGYHSMSQNVVDKINGMKIGSMSDIPKALAQNPESKFDVIEFEMDEPAIVLDKSQLESAQQSISQNYGIDKNINID
ncbi:MAG: hypothetical protein A2Y10_19460 [Planctomycetes bacterium GWF2_41_51]|nr:MAG: hypothetical protein A2Y10_19460 [Planctomycetes bacterium GWF2_41_51]HBG28160.1 hypothetical protein [Phycisphaerales bacterium]